MLLNYFTTLYNHGFIFVPKEDGTTEWASDMTKLNKITEEEVSTLPNLHSLLRESIGNNVFSSLNIFACHNQFKVREMDTDYLGFEDPLTGMRYKWTRCYFGLKNMSSFVSFIMTNSVFREKSCSDALVFNDHITCYNKSHKFMLENLRDVFERVRFFGLRFKSTN